MFNIQAKSTTKSIITLLFIVAVSLLLISSAAMAQVQVQESTESHIRSLQTKIIVSNNSNQTSKNIRIEVPLISATSPAQETIEEAYTINPTTIKNGTMDSRIGTFFISSLAPGATETIIIDYSLEFQPTAPLLTLELEAPLLTEFLSSAPKIESDNPSIRNRTLEVTKNAESDLDKAHKIFTFVKSHMKYSLASPYRNKGALSALQNAEGVCEDYAALFVAMARVADIPARQVNGFANPRALTRPWDVGSQPISLSGYRHSWVEFYIDGLGWLPADPTFSPKADDSKYFGYLPQGSHIAQNYMDQSLRASFQGSTNGMSIKWEEALIQ